MDNQQQNIPPSETQNESTHIKQQITSSPIASVDSISSFDKITPSLSTPVAAIESPAPLQNNSVPVETQTTSVLVPSEAPISPVTAAADKTQGTNAEAETVIQKTGTVNATDSTSTQAPEKQQYTQDSASLSGQAQTPVSDTSTSEGTPPVPVKAPTTRAQSPRSQHILYTLADSLKAFSKALLTEASIIFNT